MDCHQHIFEQFRDAMGKLPKRILFYRSKWFRSCESQTQLTYVLPPSQDGVSEGEYPTTINEELSCVRSTPRFASLTHQFDGIRSTAPQVHAQNWASARLSRWSSSAGATRLSSSPPPWPTRTAAGTALWARSSTLASSAQSTSIIISTVMPGNLAQVDLRTTQSSSTRTTSRMLFHRIPDSVLDSALMHDYLVNGVTAPMASNLSRSPSAMSTLAPHARSPSRPLSTVNTFPLYLQHSIPMYD